MKITFDAVSDDFRYPLSQKQVATLFRQFPEDIVSRIRAVRFGCNQKTTQEARLVQKSGVFELRLNFCPKKGATLVLSDDIEFTKPVVTAGGIIDFSRRLVKWSSEAAARYASYLIAHEIAHLLYAEEHGDGTLKGKTSSKEERWCDQFALNFLEKLPRAGDS